jgi:hypothetical protein
MKADQAGRARTRSRDEARSEAPDSLGEEIWYEEQRLGWRTFLIAGSFIALSGVGLAVMRACSSRGRRIADPP